MRRLPVRSRKSMLGLLALLHFAAYPDVAMARGYHSYSSMPDWMVSLFLIVGGAFLLLFSLGNSATSWHSKNYLKAVIWGAVAALSCWLVLSQINWGYIAGLGLMGASWLLLGLGILTIGFVLKVLVGVFFKPARHASTEEFIHGVASIVGLIGSSVFFILMWATIFLGIPIFIISKIFGLWE